MEMTQFDRCAKRISGLQLLQSTIAEKDFLAENTLITISPTFRHPVLRFISGEFGPFEPYVPVDVPLWLAIMLRKSEKCSIQIPEWMDAARLEQYVRDEQSQSDFQEIPYYFSEIALILLNNAKDEIADYDKVSALIRDLENVRYDRVMVGLQSVAAEVVKGQMVHEVKLQNMSAAEVYGIKRFFLESTRMFDHMTTTESPAANLGGGVALGGDTAASGGSRLRRFRK